MNYFFVFLPLFFCFFFVCFFVFFVEKVDFIYSFGRQQNNQRGPRDKGRGNNSLAPITRSEKEKRTNSKKKTEKKIQIKAKEKHIQRKYTKERRRKKKNPNILGGEGKRENKHGGGEKINGEMTK